MTTLTCPKCGSSMRSYERNRVLVDQCTGCGGLFLDRGELESLVAAENAWHATASAPAPAAAAHTGAPQDRRRDDRYESRGYDPRYPRKKKKSFLSELFDD